MKNILCVYSTRQIDSNLFMSSSIFNGLQQCGYHVDMLFLGTKVSQGHFKGKCEKYFHKVFYMDIKESLLFKLCKLNPTTHVAYNFYRGFIMDTLIRPYRIHTLKQIVQSKYDEILTFVPIALSAYLAYDVRKYTNSEAKLTQYWTDPLSLGQLDDIHNIPLSRRWHKHVEGRIIKLMDRAVFCYPLFCESMQELYPKYADRMSWSDIAYMKHEKANYKPNNQRITIGMFGAYQRRVRNIYPLLNIINYFPEVQFVIRGDSDIFIDPKKYPNLDIKPGRVPLAEVEELEANCDILLCLAGRSGITIPAGKVFYYGDYNKPILYIGDGAHKDYCAKYMRSFGRYEICDNTEDSISKGIKACIGALDRYCVSIPKRMEPAVIAKKIIENSNN